MRYETKHWYPITPNRKGAVILVVTAPLFVFCYLLSLSESFISFLLLPKPRVCRLRFPKLLFFAQEPRLPPLSKAKACA